MWFAEHWYLVVGVAMLLPVLLAVLGWRFVLRVLRLQNVVNRRAMGLEQAERVLRTGQPATATVLDCHDTGMRVEAIYILVRLKFRVEPESGMSAFEGELIAPISPVRLAEFSLGRSVRLRVDPASREIAIDQPTR